MPAPSPTSLLDLVNDADQPVGRIERRNVFQAGVGFRVVHILVQNAVSDLLLQQVGANRERSPLRWGSSVAGYVHAGESYAQAAERRLSEELGLDSPVSKLGAIRMSDQGANKFIELFHTPAQHASIREPEHIESIAFWRIDEIEQTLASSPEMFTETFPHVFRLFRLVAV